MSPYQKGFIELKGARKLPGELVNTVKPLKKYWTSLVFIMILPMATPISKTMTKLQPLTCHQNLESLIGKSNKNIISENSCMKSETNVGLSKKVSYFTNCPKTRNSVLTLKSNNLNVEVTNQVTDLPSVECSKTKTNPIRLLSQS